MLVKDTADNILDAGLLDGEVFNGEVFEDLDGSGGDFFPVDSDGGLVALVFEEAAERFELSGGGGLGEGDFEIFLRGVLADEFFQVAIIGYFSLVDDDDPFAESSNVLHVMGGEDDGCLAFLVVGFDELSDLFLHDNVQTDGWFIKKKDFRGVEKGADKLHFHPLAKGEFSKGCVQKV